jgi:hypothetical protein
MDSQTGASTDPARRIYRKVEDVSFTRFGDEALLVVPRGSWQLVLSDTGARVLELLDGKEDAGRIARTIADEYEGASPETVLEDVVEVLEDLREKGAVELVEA